MMKTTKGKRTKIKAGDKYGRLTIIKEIEPHYYKDLRRRRTVICRCDCGKLKEIHLERITSGHTKSCGCLGSTRHGKTKTKIYCTWCEMKSRCLNKNNEDYKHYGHRGITVCKRWLKFENFYEDMGEKPSDKYSIDRIDNDGDYCKENCRWATVTEQNNNRSNSIKLYYKGKTHTLSEWSELVGLKSWVIYNRIKLLGWSAEKTLTTRTVRIYSKNKKANLYTNDRKIILSKRPYLEK